ncbi:MAG: S9 family peptidase [Acidobacteria bacterium]|nr:S9 family peptidase [Acidobacteriota bacterium]MCA1639514.1 S9 family peptidase [Acidobacteriota bacterium]
MRQKTFFVAFLLALALCANAQTDSSKKLTLDLFLDWEYVMNPQISPDGTQIVYTRRWTDKINDKYENEVWIMNADGSRNRFLFKGSSPVWSHDGKRIAYVAPGQPTGTQIFVKWMDAPDVGTQITTLERPPANLAWSPDGKRIAFNMIVAAKSQLKVTMPPRPDGAKWTEPARVIDRLNYRSDASGYRPEGFMHIFVVGDTGGVPRQLTEGDYNHNAPEWMNDSNTIVFSAIRKPDAEYVRFGTEIYAMNVKTNQIRALTDRDGPDQEPTISPDGKRIAYIGFDRNSDTYNVQKLYVMDTDGQNKRVLTETFDRSPFGLMWSANSNDIYFATEDKGTNNLYSVGRTGGAVRQITKGNYQFLPSNMSNNGVITGVLSDAKEPGDVVVMNLKQPAPRKLTSVNDDLLEGRKLGDVEEIWYDSVGGMKVQGWIVKPPDFNPSKKYPLILYIHGGPHSMYGIGFNFEFQNHAAENYVVLYTNPRGSTGYGKNYGNAINNAYPGQDYDDLMRGVDEVIKRGYIDEKNLFVTGGSGGGVLTAWIVGHTDRFAAAVSMKPVINWYSFVGTTDGADWYYNFKKLPWEDPTEHLQRSPITYVGNVKTPTMLLTGELDLRTPMEQTEQYYRALKMRKVPTAMVRLNDEYHGFNALGLRHPSNRLSQILYLRTWFEKYKRK